VTSEYEAGLRKHTRAGELAEVLPHGVVRCLACAHSCHIKEGAAGICGVRWNRDGVLMVPWGYTSSVACDPIEKKPFYHFLPGEEALSFGMLGCNLHCEFCQNWSISQTLKDPDAVVFPQLVSAEALLQTAARHGTPIMASTYNEPLISTEWAAHIFRLARQQGMKTCYISNGFASPEVLAYLAPWLDAANVDLKCFSEAGYKWLGGRLAPVMEAIAELWKMGKWVEVITLLVPGFNDTPEELKKLTDFLVGVSPDIPWHVSAYHANYKMRGGCSATPIASIKKAMGIGRQAGLRYIYAGNVRGEIAGSSDTCCHECGLVCIQRSGFGAGRKVLTSAGTCPACGTAIPGLWDQCGIQK